MRDPDESSPRGFSKEDGMYYYRTRDNEQLTLTVEEYVPLRVFEDMLNRHLFVNTMDLKRTLKAMHAVIAKNSRGPHRRGNRRGNQRENRR